jgi:hypothetical protein
MLHERDDEGRVVIDPEKEAIVHRERGDKFYASRRIWRSQQGVHLCIREKPTADRTSFLTL